MEKGEIIKEVCLHLLNDNKTACLEIAGQKYPFKSYQVEKRKSNFFQMAKIFLRDGFIDRYFGEKLLFPGIFRILKLELPEAFPAHINWKMTDTHLVYWELFPIIDHVYPIARGGEDTEDNLVTTSMLRNAAKANWTLDEIGWTKKEMGKLEDWDGLTSIFLNLVKKNPELRKDNYIKNWENALLKATN